MATKQEETASSRREARLQRAERRQMADHGAPMTSKNTSHHNSGPHLKMPKLSEGQLELLFRRLNLAHTRRIYQDLGDRAEKENWSYRDFLALLLAEEVAHRKQTRLQRFTEATVNDAAKHIPWNNHPQNTDDSKGVSRKKGE